MVRRGVAPPGSRGRTLAALVGWAALLVLAAGLGAAAVTRTGDVLLLAGAAGLALLVLRPGWAAVGVLVALPFPVSVVPGLPLDLAASDLLTVAALTGWALRALLAPGHGPRPHPVRPLALGLVAYAVVAVASLVVHPSATGLVTAGQRALIVVGALVVGGGLVREGLLRVGLEGFLASASVLAVGAVAFSGDEAVLGVQKNPAGGYLAAALIVAIVVRPSRRWLLHAPVLAVGVLSTQSRGALVGLAVGAGVTILVVRLRDRVRLLAGFGGAGVLLLATFLTLSPAARDRLQDITSGTDFAVQYRQDFQDDALDTFRAHPWLGVGVGSYTGGPRVPGGPGSDPHQVFYLQLAEGGVLLLAAFLLLLGVSLWVPLRSVRRSGVAVAALAVQLSTVVHAQADVYWVRGTPTAGFLLVGAAAAVAWYAARGDPRGTAFSTAPAPRRPRPALASAP